MSDRLHCAAPTPGRPRVRAITLRLAALFAAALALASLPASAGPGLGNSAGSDWLAPLPVQDSTLRLPNGDAADVYAPVVPPSARHRHADAFPLVALLQGALVEKGQYRHFARLLASQGLVVVVPDHLRPFPGIPVPVRFSEVGVVTAVYDGAVAAERDPRSPLYRIIDTDSMAMVGHSLGGFVGLYAIAGVCDPQICSAPGGTYSPPAALRAGAVYGASLVDYDGSVIDLDTSRAPVALMQGDLDGIGIPAKAQATYPILESPRALIELHGANHYGICDDNNPAGGTRDPIDPTLPQWEANFDIARWIGLWLRAQLKDDPWARFWVYRGGGPLT